MIGFARKQNIKYLLFAFITASVVLAASWFYSAQELKHEKHKFNKADMLPQDAYDFLKANKDNKEVVLLDLRTPGEYAEEHISGSVFAGYFSEDFNDKLSGMDKNKTYILYCKAGRVCPKVIKQMKSLGFKEAHKIEGGIKEWKAGKLPLDFSK
jgi:rhodanese-related sulfurtransferase